jgi:hypothetical protein
MIECITSPFFCRSEMRRPFFVSRTEKGNLCACEEKLFFFSSLFLFTKERLRRIVLQIGVGLFAFHVADVPRFVAQIHVLNEFACECIHDQITSYSFFETGDRDTATRTQQRTRQTKERPHQSLNSIKFWGVCGEIGGEIVGRD